MRQIRNKEQGPLLENRDAFDPDILVVDKYYPNGF